MGWYVVPDLSVDYFRRDLARTILADIDKYAVAKYDGGFRTHLGASVIGQECTRAAWYGWRWMARSNQGKDAGRMQRLFQRGHLEEFRYAEYLRGIGAELWAEDVTLPVNEDGTYPQFRVSKVGGHFGGSLDGIVSFERNYNIKPKMLAEFKTKGAGPNGKGAGFAKLKSEGIMLSNPQHYDQMCTYGAEYKLDYALYMAVNKNDDDLHVEIVPLSPKRAAEVESKAVYVIRQQTPPPRISLNPTHFKCKMCDFHAVCHENRLPERNCRSCVCGSAADNKAWYCSGYKAIIPEHVIKTGCANWNGIPSPPG